MKKKEICLISSNPNFDGGVILYQKNLIKYLKDYKKNKNLKITWIYRSNKDESYVKEDINYVGLKTIKIPFIEDIEFNRKCSKYLKQNNFDIINSHAIWGYWMKNYKKKENQKIIHTYHGATFPYYKVQLKRFGIIKKMLLSPLLLYSYFIEKPPIKKSDKIICVSEKVKRQIEEVYFKRKNMFVIRTGVDLNHFKKREKYSLRENLGLDKDKLYGLCVGRGGYWIKGLDRAIKISEEIYKLNKNFRLIIIGADKNKVDWLLNKDFIVYYEKIPRDKIPGYYCASDLFFCLSRYEGGAPTLVVSEAMASGCFLVCSKDSNQEIIKDNENGLIIDNFREKEAERILKTLKDRKLKEKIIKNSINTIKKISLEDWGNKYSKLIGL